MSKKKKDIITIDGPAGSGKSTVSHMVSKILKYQYLDTGAMYRAVALIASKNNIEIIDNEKLHNFLNQLDIRLDMSSDGLTIWANGKEVSQGIRQPHIAGKASDYSKLRSVREFCMKIQRNLGKEGRIVAEGRDMGTVVFPDARWKFFLIADAKERALRRWRQEVDKDSSTDIQDVYQEIYARDKQDQNRSIAPLKPAIDAHVIDSSNLSINEVVNRIVGRVREKS